MGTSACIGYKNWYGKIAYVTCRFDGYLEHVGMLLVEQYNDIDKVVELLCCGDIESLRYDLESIERERPLDCDQLEGCKVKIANDVYDYLLKGMANTSISPTRGCGMSLGGCTTTMGSLQSNAPSSSPWRWRWGIGD